MIFLWKWLFCVACDILYHLFPFFLDMSALDRKSLSDSFAFLIIHTF